MAVVHHLHLLRLSRLDDAANGQDVEGLVDGEAALALVLLDEGPRVIDLDRGVVGHLDQLPLDRIIENASEQDLRSLEHEVGEVDVRDDR